MIEQTIEQLHRLRLGAMADAFKAQQSQAELDDMPFEERFALLVDCQHAATESAALAQ